MRALEPEDTIQPVLFEESFEELLPAMMALRAGEIIPVNLSIPDAVTKALAVRPLLLAWKDGIAHALGEKECDFPERLVVFALALSHAHVLYRLTPRPKDAIPPLAEEGMNLRSLLFSDARALITRGLVGGQSLRGYKGSVGYRNLALDLHRLVLFFRDCPASARQCSAARDAELRRAEELAAAILVAVERRKVPDPAVKAAADVRDRAFTLFTRGYDRMRRAVTSLRWEEGDADWVVPSLYKKRRRPKKTESTPTSEHSS